MTDSRSNDRLGFNWGSDDDPLYMGDGFTEKPLHRGTEGVGILGRQVADAASARVILLYLGMALEVLAEAVGDIAALTHNGDMRGHMTADAVHEEREMGTSEDDAVDARIGLHESSHMLTYEVVSPG